MYIEIPQLLATLYNVRKPNNFESHNSPKLSFTNIWGLCSNFIECKSLLELNSPDIVLHETNLANSIEFSSFFMTSYISVIRRYSVTYMHGLAVFAKEELPFARDLYLENSEGSYLRFRLALLHSMFYLIFLHQSPSSPFCKVFDAISSRRGSLNQPIC